MAVGCYPGAEERGLSIPRDVSVIGYDDEEVARHLTPPTDPPGPATSRDGPLGGGEGAVTGAQWAGTHPPTKLECPLIERAHPPARQGVT